MFGDFVDCRFAKSLVGFHRVDKSGHDVVGPAQLRLLVSAARSVNEDDSSAPVCATWRSIRSRTSARDAALAIQDRSTRTLHRQRSRIDHSNKSECPNVAATMIARAPRNSSIAGLTKAISLGPASG